MEYSIPHTTRLLLEHGLEVDHTDVNGDTPLHIATRASSASLILMLLKFGANFDIKNNNQLTAKEEATSQTKHLFDG